MKRLALLDMVDYLATYKSGLSEAECVEVFEMININLFRPLVPPRPVPFGIYNPEEEEPRLELSWPHLQIVYEFLLRLLNSNGE